MQYSAGTSTKFNGRELVVPPELREKLNFYQRMYLTTCVEVPVEVLGLGV